MADLRSSLGSTADVCPSPSTRSPARPSLCARSLRTLAYRYDRQAEFVQAESLYQRAIAIQETVLGPEALEVANTLDVYAALMRQTNRAAEAAKLEERARAIRARR